MTIRLAHEKDIETLNHLAMEMGFGYEPAYFERCFLEQDAEKRHIFIAEGDRQAAGYVQLIWRSAYLPFQRLDMPEIQDLNVIPAMRGSGIGGALVDHCEQEARNKGKKAIGISVGLYARYGAAQRLYIKRGYVPDGAGVVYDDVTVQGGEMRVIDDFLALKLTKDL